VLTVFAQAPGAASGAVRVLGPGALVLARVGAAYAATAVVTWLLAGAPPPPLHRDSSVVRSSLAAVRALSDADFMPAVLLSVALVSGTVAHQLVVTASATGGDDGTIANSASSGDVSRAVAGSDASPPAGSSWFDRLLRQLRDPRGFGRSMLLQQRRMDRFLAMLLALVDNIVDPCAGAATLLLALHSAAAVFSGEGAGFKGQAAAAAATAAMLEREDATTVVAAPPSVAGALPAHILRVQGAVLACEGLLALRRFVVLSRSISALQAARSEAMRAPFDASRAVGSGTPSTASIAAATPTGASALLFINDALQRARAQRLQIVTHAVATVAVVVAFITWACGGGLSVSADAVDAPASPQHLRAVALPAAVVALAIVRVAASSAAAF